MRSAVEPGGELHADAETHQRASTIAEAERALVPARQAPAGDRDLLAGIRRRIFGTAG